MWYFRSPEIVFGEGALDHLAEIGGRRALLVTDATLVGLGVAEAISSRLRAQGLVVETFADVEPNPSLETVRAGAAAALTWAPDWIVGLGGGSCLDAAKAIWILYERPDLSPDGIAPVGALGLRRKARLIAIPTTSGTGAETTWPIVLTDTAIGRKISVGHPECVPDVAIVDPALVRDLPARLTADTGMDALTHAIEGYTAQWANDFSDGLCLHAARLVFEYLPRAVALGAADAVAREKMHNAATLAGLGFGNSMAAMAHALGHSLGAVCHVPHGRAVGLFLPYTIAFTARGSEEARYADVAQVLGLSCADEAAGAAALAQAVRDLARQIGQPLTLREAGLGEPEFEACLPHLLDNALNDGCIVMGRRYATAEEVERLLRYAYDGREVDF